MPRIPCPKILKAVLTLPGDKSISHRAVMLSAIAKGTTTICNFLDSDDTLATLNAFKRLGAAIAYDRKNATVTVRGKGKFLKPKTRTLAMQESGTTIRLIAGILSGQRFQTTLTAGPSLKKRPMKRIDRSGVRSSSRFQLDSRGTPAFATIRQGIPVTGSASYTNSE